MMPRHRKRGDNPTPHERYLRDPETNEVKAVSRPIARSRTMPLEPTKPKDAPTFYKVPDLVRDSKGRQILARPVSPSTSISPSLTKHKHVPRLPQQAAQYPGPGRPVPLGPKSTSTTIPSSPTEHDDAPRTPDKVARDYTPEKPVPLRPTACCPTMSPEFKEKGDPNERRNPAPDYITMQSKGYDKSKGRTTYPGGRADITTEGSDVDEAADDDASAARGEAADRGGTAVSDPAGTEAAGTAEAMLKRLLVKQVVLEERLLVMEARLERRLLVMEALLLQERWRFRRGSLGESSSGEEEEEEGDEGTMVGGSETDD
ncbi:hypothetical protein BDR22DRAFT_484989 [Usnea florida]